MSTTPGEELTTIAAAVTASEARLGLRPHALFPPNSPNYFPKHSPSRPAAFSSTMSH